MGSCASVESAAISADPCRRTYSDGCRNNRDLPSHLAPEFRAARGRQSRSLSFGGTDAPRQRPDPYFRNPPFAGSETVPGSWREDHPHTRMQSDTRAERAALAQKARSYESYKSAEKSIKGPKDVCNAYDLGAHQHRDYAGVAQRAHIWRKTANKYVARLVR